MSDLFRQMQAESFAAKLLPVAEPATIYLVAAWNAQNGYWKIFRESNHQEYTTVEAAESAAAKLGANWLYQTIVRVDLHAA